MTFRQHHSPSDATFLGLKALITDSPAAIAVAVPECSDSVMTRIKVLTLNLWDFGASLDRRDALLVSGLKRLQPDIVCLQEVSRLRTTQRAHSELFATPCASLTIFFSGVGESEARAANLPRNMEGLSILSRFPALRQASVALPYFAGDIPRKIFLAELSIGRSRIAVATTHLAFPPAFFREREMQVRKASTLSISSQCRLIWMRSFSRETSTRIGLTRVAGGAREQAWIPRCPFRLPSDDPAPPLRRRIPTSARALHQDRE